MPLQKILFKPGVNKENTRYTTEGGWYDCDKVRFRQGTPEKIGGWEQISANSYTGICRSLWAWSTLSGADLTGVGTNVKFYIEQGGYYNDVTPIRAVSSNLSNPFAAVVPQTFTVTIASPAVLTAGSLANVRNGMTFTFTTTGTLPTGLSTGVTYYAVNSSSNTCQLALTADGTPINTSGTQSGTHSLTSKSVVVTSAAHGASNGDYVTFMGALALSTQAFTRSTATDFVLTSALAENTPVILSSTGTLPTGLTAGVQYYIHVVSGTTVNFCNVPSGAAVSTSTAGSGTFTLYVNTGMTATVLDQNYQLTVIDGNSYVVNTTTAATAYDVGGGGTTVDAVYEISPGYAISVPLTGWGAGSWGIGAWGIGTAGTAGLRLWTQQNFGQDLLFNYRGGPIYYWSALTGPTMSAVTVTIASPGVLTYSNGGFINGTAVQLLTTGALPTGLTAGTVYYVVNASGNNFSLAATPGGTAITTTGSQSGTHYISPRGIALTSLAYTSDVPTKVNMLFISDTSRFVFALGSTPTGGGELDPMLVRWSDQESAVNWLPSITNQAGDLRLSHGSEIKTAVQTRQEVVIITDSAVYSMQYLGPPYVWGSQLLADNTSLAGYNTAIAASGVVYWMGVDKFYKYDGRVQTLRCDLRQHIFNNINLDQQNQFFSGTIEGFNEVWWFYCSANSTTIDSYVVYNYSEDIWYYGSMARTAWIDSGLYDYPLAATYSSNLVWHELGLDDNTSGTPAAINSYISSSEFDIGDGHNFGFVWRLIPDVTFRGSTAASPQVIMYLRPLQNSGSGYNVPESIGGDNNASVTRTATVPIEQFTGQVLIRVRGRQMAFKIEGNQVGLQWQLGAPRIDIKPDGRRGNT